MGYELHITRAEVWTEAAQNPISEAEWHSLVRSDASLELSTTDYYERKTKAGGTERIYAVFWKGATYDWNGKPHHPAFFLADGEVTTKSPQEVTVKKAIEIAEKLGAQVIGDDGEQYT
jgi:hypothetical protein